MTDPSSPMDKEAIFAVQRQLLKEVLIWLDQYDPSLRVTLPWQVLRQCRFDEQLAIRSRKAYHQYMARAYEAYKQLEEPMPVRSLQENWRTHVRAGSLPPEAVFPGTGEADPEQDRSDAFIPTDPPSAKEHKGESTERSVETIRQETLRSIRRWVGHYRKNKVVALPWHMLSKHNFSADQAIAARKAEVQAKASAFLRKTRDK